MSVENRHPSKKRILPSLDLIALKAKLLVLEDQKLVRVRAFDVHMRKTFCQERKDLLATFAYRKHEDT